MFGFSSALEGEHESEDRDAVLRWLGAAGNNDSAVVQFKYSSSVPPRTIYRGEFEEIVDNLEPPLIQRAPSGTRASRYALVTNRPLSKELNDCLVQRGRGLSEWRRGKDLEPTLGAKCLAKLHYMIFVFRSMEDWEDGIARFARTYGLLDEEIEPGIDRLCGVLARDTSTGAEPAMVTEEIMRLALTGYSGAVSLAPSSGTLLAVECLHSFKEDRVPLAGPPVRRREQAQLSDLAGQLPVVLVTGLGGSGKTVALWEWASDSVDGDSRAECFVAIAFAPEITDRWVHDLVWAWRGMSSGQDSKGIDPALALKRVMTANPETARPVVCLALDGVDNDLPPRAIKAIRRLLQVLVDYSREGTAAAGPPVTLVATCRSQHEFDRIIGLDQGFGRNDVADVIKSVPFGDFEPAELALGAQDAVSDGVLEPVPARRLTQALLKTLPEGTEAIASGFLTTTETETEQAQADVSEEVLSALRHPVLWRAFLQLQSEHLRVAVLDAEAEGLQALASIFVRRFEFQAVERLGERLTRPGMALDVLVSAARRTRSLEAGVAGSAEWEAAALEVSDVSQFVASLLFREALSGGVIVESAGGWRWRHRFVSEHLATFGYNVSPP